MPGYKRKRGDAWQLQVYKGRDPETGKKLYYRETFRGTDYQADKRLAEIITDMDRQEFIEPTKITLYEFCIKHYLPGVKGDLEEGTYDEYESIIKNHIKNDPIAKFPLSRVELQHIEGYKVRKLNGKRADGREGTLSPKTVKNHLICIKAIFSYACRLRVLKWSPAQYVTYPKITKFKPTTWTEEQAGRFLDVAFWDRFYFLYLLGVFYSKRKGELRGLRKEDVDLNALTASIRQSVRKSGNSAKFKNLKDEDSEHVLELEQWMVPFFEREFAERAKEKLAFGEGYKDHGLVFASYNGNPVKERTLNEHFEKIIKRAGVPEIRFHDLRHTCITIMLKRGWSLKHAQERAHHADIRTTGNNYSHITPDMNRDVNHDLAKALKLKVNTGEVLEFRPLDKINNARRTKKASQK
jgi:integrase